MASWAAGRGAHATDERDHAIMWRSVSFAHYALVVGVIIVGVIMPFTSNGWPIINAALFMVVAKVVHDSAGALSYRRQA